MNESGQERAVNRYYAAENEVKESGWRKLGRILAKILLILTETVLLLAIILYAAMYVMAKGPSPTIRKIFVTSVRETSAIGFLANLYLTEDEIQYDIIYNRNYETLDDFYDDLKKGKYKENDEDLSSYKYSIH